RGAGRGDKHIGRSGGLVRDVVGPRQGAARLGVADGFARLAGVDRVARGALSGAATVRPSRAGPAPGTGQCSGPGAGIETGAADVPGGRGRVADGLGAGHGAASALPLPAARPPGPRTTDYAALARAGPRAAARPLGTALRAGGDGAVLVAPGR